MRGLSSGLSPWNKPTSQGSLVTPLPPQPQRSTEHNVSTDTWSTHVRLHQSPRWLDLLPESPGYDVGHAHRRLLGGFHAQRAGRVVRRAEPGGQLRVSPPGRPRACRRAAPAEAADLELPGHHQGREGVGNHQASGGTLGHLRCS